jgi:hypothetical protein
MTSLENLEQKLAIRERVFSEVSEGFLNGGMIGLDPLGAIFSKLTNYKTIGGNGLMDCDYFGKIKAGINAKSSIYKSAKALTMGVCLTTLYMICGAEDGIETMAIQQMGVALLNTYVTSTSKDKEYS